MDETSTLQAPDTGLAAYQVVLSLPLPALQRAWLLVALHRAAGHPPPSRAEAVLLAERGPVLSWDALGDLSPQRRAHLRAVFSAPQLHQHLAAQLQRMPAAPPSPEPQPEPSAWPRLPAPPPSHPLGPGARYPPRIASALGVAQGEVIGAPISLPGFPFSPQIVGFRAAISEPPPEEGLVIGGGYVGAEVALGWAEAGAVVTLVEQGPRLMPRFFDAEVLVVGALLAEAGVRVQLETTATAWAQHGARIRVSCTSRGEADHLVVDRILVAVGVVPPGFSGGGSGPG